MKNEYKYLNKQIQHDLIEAEATAWMASVNKILREVDEAHGYYEHEALVHVTLEAMGAITVYIEQLYEDMNAVLDHEPSLALLLGKLKKADKIRGQYADMHNMCDNICAALQLYDGDEEEV